MRLITVKNISKFLLNGPNSIQKRCQSSNFLQTSIDRKSQLKEFVTAKDGPNSIQIGCKSSNYLRTPMGGIRHTEKVVTTENNSMFVAWHPTSEFPYEYTRPLPPPAIATSTLLKDEAIRKSMEAFTKKHPEIARRELERITYTSKHVWRPQLSKIRKIAWVRKQLNSELNKK